jgi:hypothetical protein
MSRRTVEESIGRCTSTRKVDATRFIDFDFSIVLNSLPYPFTPFHPAQRAALILTSVLLVEYDAAQSTMRKPPLALLDGRYANTVS